MVKCLILYTGTHVQIMCFLIALSDLYNFYSDVVPKVMEGDTDLLSSLVDDHISGTRTFCNLRSR